MTRSRAMKSSRQRKHSKPINAEIVDVAEIRKKINVLEYTIRFIAFHVEGIEHCCFKDQLYAYMAPSRIEFELLDVKQPFVLDYDAAMLEGIPKVPYPRLSTFPDADIDDNLSAITCYTADESMDMCDNTADV